MKLKKPKFWDYKKPNIMAYFLLPLSFLTSVINYLKNKPLKIKKEIKTICIGNIYLGGTGKTPLSIKINQLLNKQNYKTAFIKKYYKDQIDEQKILEKNGRLFCKKDREKSLNEAINSGIEVCIFDDGLQDKKIKYDISFVCFNNQSFIGNGFLIPAGPLRENLKNLLNYDAIFLNGNNEDNLNIKNIIKNINPNLEIFESLYEPIDINKLNKEDKYLVFSGIGNPDTFIKTLKNNGFNIIKNLDFPDHYNYSDNDIQNIKNLAKKFNAKILTTEKDFMRLNKTISENINYLKINLKIKNEGNLINFLKERL